jgi:hypothetical protein
MSPKFRPLHREDSDSFEEDDNYFVTVSDQPSISDLDIHKDNSSSPIHIADESLALELEEYKISAQLEELKGHHVTLMKQQHEQEMQLEEAYLTVDRLITGAKSNMLAQAQGGAVGGAIDMTAALYSNPEGLAQLEEKKNELIHHKKEIK